MQLSGMSDKFHLWTRNFYAYLLENGSLWGWHKPWIGGWKLRPQRIWSRKCKENHRDCFNMHSIITSFKATNVRNSCFAQKLGFTGAQHVRSQPDDPLLNLLKGSMGTGPLLLLPPWCLLHDGLIHKMWRATSATSLEDK